MSACTWWMKVARGPGRPQRGEERQAVPDLEEAVAAAARAAQLLEGRVEEHEVATAPAHDAVPVAHGPRSSWPWAWDVRIDARRCPAAAHARGDLGGVHLRATGLDVVEVAPGEDVHPAQPGGGGDVAQLAAIGDGDGHGMRSAYWRACRRPSGTAGGASGGH